MNLHLKQHFLFRFFSNVVINNYYYKIFFLDMYTFVRPKFRDSKVLLLKHRLYENNTQKKIA